MVRQRIVTPLPHEVDARQTRRSRTRSVASTAPPPTSPKALTAPTSVDVGSPAGKGGAPNVGGSYDSTMTAFEAEVAAADMP